MEFKRRSFAQVDVVLVYAWLLDGQSEFFVFDGLAEVLRFLGPVAQGQYWIQNGRWRFATLPKGHQALLDSDFRDRWDVIHRRLGQAGMAPVQTKADGGTYELTRHARERVEAGEVQEAWIAATLAAPDRDEEDPLRPGIRRAWKRIEAFGGRALRVAYRQDGAVTVVITAFFDRGAPT
jgi:hypothetical protein